MTQDECCNRQQLASAKSTAPLHAISNRQTPELLEFELTGTKQRTKYFLIASQNAFFAQNSKRQLPGNAFAARRVSPLWPPMRPIWMAPCLP